MTLPYRHYDYQTDRLFLVYYSLPSGPNANGWGVTDSSYETNIRTAINKPVIIYRKEPTNRWHTHQAGNYVHPTIEQATEEFGGREPTEEEYYQWQEKWAVGRVKKIDKREGKGYAWTLEITDPEVKNLLKEDKYQRGIPGWTSPQILTYSGAYPEEDKSQQFDHWIVSHVILTDRPAYGFEKSSLKGKCLGAEKECLIKTKNASQENIGFCVKGATVELLDARASDSSSKQKQNSELITMSSSQTLPSSNNEVVVAKTFSEQNPKQEEGEVPSSNEGPTDKERGETERAERPSEESERVSLNLPLDLPKTLEDSHKEIVQLREQIKVKDEMQRTTSKEMKKILAWKDQIEAERKEYLLRSVIPRNLFKSDDSYAKEIQKITTLGLDKDLDWLKEHYHIMTQAKMAQEQTELKPQIKVKSASVNPPTVYEVPDYETQKQILNNDSSQLDKLLNLQRKMLGGQI